MSEQTSKRQQLRDLIFSQSPENIRLGLELIQGQSMQVEMRTELYLLHLLGNHLVPQPQVLELLGPAAAAVMTRFMSLHPQHGTPKMDVIGHLSNHPEIEHEALMDFAWRHRPLHQAATHFITHANARQFRAWVGECGHMELENQNLHGFPEVLRSVPELEQLSLANNHILHLPDWLPELARLRILDLSVNPMQSLSPRIADLYLLRSLFLDHNRISSVDSLEKSPSLEHLSLKHCMELTERGLEKLPLSLQQLNLAGTSLRFLPSALRGHPRLALINLTGMKKLDGQLLLETLQQLPALKIVVLDRDFPFPLAKHLPGVRVV